MCWRSELLPLDFSDTELDEFNDLSVTDVQIEGILGDEKSRDGTEEENNRLGGPGGVRGLRPLNNAGQRGKLSTPECVRRLCDLGSNGFAVIRQRDELRVETSVRAI